jgi:hypothetical protein
MPENTYYSIVEPAMNNAIMSKTFTNKNLYDILYPSIALLPTTYLRRIDGKYYDLDYKPIIGKIDLKQYLNCFDSCIVKDTLDTGGGRGIDLFKKIGENFINETGEFLTTELLDKKYSDNTIVQEYILSHPYFSKFNKSSLNTIRVFTYRSVIDESIKVLHTILRIGKIGSIVDNQASGGISCGIDNGRLKSFAIDKYGNRYEEIGGNFFQNQYAIPFYKEIIGTAVSIAQKNLYSRVLGLDLCVDNNDQVRLIEVNNRNNEINFFQMNNGPLFENYTDEIMKYSIASKKALCFDFFV